eukprot:GFYU01007586.1.p1 GENE.GFYU01007586.1~~GFYU01007586.1.p1  ORF type:complete len:499 (-),score=101.19 GFYU01007586.1:36-1532(-)
MSTSNDTKRSRDDTGGEIFSLLSASSGGVADTQNRGSTGTAVRLSTRDDARPRVSAQRPPTSPHQTQPQATPSAPSTETIRIAQRKLAQSTKEQEGVARAHREGKLTLRPPPAVSEPPLSPSGKRKRSISSPTVATANKNLAVSPLIEGKPGNPDDIPSISPYVVPLGGHSGSLSSQDGTDVGPQMTRGVRDHHHHHHEDDGCSMFLLLFVMMFMICTLTGVIYIYGVPLFNDHYATSSEPTTDNLYVDVEVTLEDVYNGNEINITRNKVSICPRCGGTGGDRPSDIIQCNTCQGKGHITRTHRGFGLYPQVIKQTCPHCSGVGFTVRKMCPKCKAKRLWKHKAAILLKIPRGLSEGEKVILKGEADQAPDYKSGDLYVTVKTKKHPKLRRKGVDLHMNLKVKLKEALLGFTRTIAHLDGREVIFTSTDVVSHGQVLKIPGEGMVQEGTLWDTRGDLHLKVLLEFPKKLSEHQKKEVSRLLEGSPTAAHSHTPLKDET